MTFEDFKKLLRENEYVNFTYTKKDGTERAAKGTLNMNTIPEEHKPSESSNYKYADDVIRYFDLDKEGWRSFRWDQFKELN